MKTTDVLPDDAFDSKGRGARKHRHHDLFPTPTPHLRVVFFERLIREAIDISRSLMVLHPSRHFR